MSFTLHLELPSPRTRADLLDALGLPDADGATPGAPGAAMPIELGRAATGTTAALIAEDGPAPGPLEGGGPARFVLLLPLVRAPWSAADVLPTVVAAVEALGGRVDPPAPLAAWQAARAAAIRELVALCEASGAPLPPFLPAAHLDALHGWLVALESPPPGPPVVPTIHCLDARDGGPVRLAVRLPRVREAAHARLPPVGGILADLDEDRALEAPQLYALGALGEAQTTRDAAGFVVVDVAAARAALARAPSEPLGAMRFVSPVEIVEAEALGSEG